MTFSIYVHIPYCEHICPYCDFNVYAVAQRPEERYVGALIGELRHAAAHAPWRGGVVGTVYFGGGTPSLFRSESIATLVGTIGSLWDIDRGVEITLEANPPDVREPALSAWRSAGVNRLSLGVQSFEPRHLARLGRQHSPEDSEAAVAAARRAGFDNLNLDLIFAVPGQTREDWDADLAAACRLGADHISAYNLTYEERTPFFAWRKHGRLVPATEDDEAVMFSRAQQTLEAAGYEQYEISNYARPGRYSRHNSNYWRGGSYLGMGAGAHSFSPDGWGERWSNERRPERYMASIEERGEARAFHEALTREQAMGEFAFLGLRQRRGVDAAQFAERFGCDFADQFPRTRDLCADGLLAKTADGYELTTRGMLIADSVFATFV